MPKPTAHDWLGVLHGVTEAPDDASPAEILNLLDTMIAEHERKYQEWKRGLFDRVRAKV